MMGTEFKKGEAILLSQKSYVYGVEFGTICLVLVNRPDVWVVVQVMESYFNPHLRAYEIECTDSYRCLPLLQSGNFKPLHIYHVSNMMCIKPEHGFVSHQL